MESYFGFRKLAVVVLSVVNIIVFIPPGMIILSLI